MIILHDLDLRSRCDRRRHYAQQVDRWLLLEEARRHGARVREGRWSRPAQLLQRVGRLLAERQPVGHRPCSTRTAP